MGWPRAKLSLAGNRPQVSITPACHWLKSRPLDASGREDQRFALFSRKGSVESFRPDFRKGGSLLGYRLSAAGERQKRPPIAQLPIPCGARRLRTRNHRPAAWQLSFAPDELSP